MLALATFLGEGIVLFTHASRTLYFLKLILQDGLLATAMATTATGAARPDHSRRSPTRRHEFDLDVGRRSYLGILVFSTMVMSFYSNFRLQHYALQFRRCIAVVYVAHVAFLMNRWNR